MSNDLSEYSRDLRGWVTEALSSRDPDERRSWCEKLARESDDVEQADGLILAVLLGDAILAEPDEQARSSELFALADLSSFDMVPNEVRDKIRTIDPTSLKRSDYGSWRRIMDPDCSD